MMNNDLLLHQDEKVIRYIRKHIFFLILDILVVLFIFLVPVLLIWFLQYTGSVPDQSLFGISLTNLSDVVVYSWGIICWLFLAERFTRYALNFWVLTNKRIIESDLPRLFDRRLSILELPDIEDVTVKVDGFIATLIGYGTLEVQTAGTKREFLAEDIMNPVKAQDEIFDAKLALKNESLIDIGYIPHDQKIASKKVDFAKEYPEEPVVLSKTEEKLADSEFDWAHKNEVEDKYKVNSAQALRVE